MEMTAKMILSKRMFWKVISKLQILIKAKERFIKKFENEYGINI